MVKRKFSGLLLRLAMTSLIEDDRVQRLIWPYLLDPLFWRSRISKQEHAHIMHHLTRVLQNGLNLHRRQPGAKMLLPRDVFAPEERVDFVEVRQFPHTLLFDQ